MAKKSSYLKQMARKGKYLKREISVCCGMYSCVDAQFDETNPHCMECQDDAEAGIALESRRIINVVNQRAKANPCDNCPEFGGADCGNCTLT